MWSSALQKEEDEEEEEEKGEEGERYEIRNQITWILSWREKMTTSRDPKSQFRKINTFQ